MKKKIMQMLFYFVFILLVVPIISFNAMNAFSEVSGISPSDNVFPFIVITLVCLALLLKAFFVVNRAMFGDSQKSGAQNTKEDEERIAMGIIDDAKKKANEIIEQANRDAANIRKNSEIAVSGSQNIVTRANVEAEKIRNEAYKEASHIKQQIDEEFWKSPEGRSVKAEEKMAEIRKKEREEMAKLVKIMADEELARNIEAAKRMQEEG